MAAESNVALEGEGRVERISLASRLRTAMRQPARPRPAIVEPCLPPPSTAAGPSMRPPPPTAAEPSSRPPPSAKKKKKKRMDMEEESDDEGIYDYKPSTKNLDANDLLGLKIMEGEWTGPGDDDFVAAPTHPTPPLDPSIIDGLEEAPSFRRLWHHQGALVAESPLPRAAAMSMFNVIASGKYDACRQVGAELPMPPRGTLSIQIGYVRQPDSNPRARRQARKLQAAERAAPSNPILTGRRRGWRLRGPVRSLLHATRSVPQALAAGGAARAAQGSLSGRHGRV